MQKNKSNKSKNSASGNRYDRIFRENASAIFMPLVERELKFKIIQDMPFHYDIREHATYKQAIFVLVFVNG